MGSADAAGEDHGGFGGVGWWRFDAGCLMGKELVFWEHGKSGRGGRRNAYSRCCDEGRA